MNKVIGNLLLWPGKSFQQSGMGMNELVPYLKEGEPHPWSHNVHYFHFQSMEEMWKPNEKELMMKKLGIERDALDWHWAVVRPIIRSTNPPC